MAVQREFLGLERPALHSAADFLLDKHRVAEGFDFRDTLLIVPGGRAGRRLQELLFDRAAMRGGRYLPPEITTVGLVPERLYRAKRPFASDWVQHLAWAQAIRQSDAEVRSRVFPRTQAEETGPWTANDWLALGKLLHRSYRELAAECLSFSHVAETAIDLEGFPEVQRWHALAVIQHDYLRLLDDLHMWDRQTARLVAIDHEECACDCAIYLVATADLRRSLCAMLDQVAGQVTALVHASGDWSDRFDGFGCIRRECWAEGHIPLADRQIVFVNGYAEQSSAVVHALDELADRYACDQISIGCADEGLVPFVQRALAAHEVNGRWGPGRSVRESGPYQLLETVKSFQDSNSFDAFAALVRHPDMSRWLSDQGMSGWIRQLDRYRQRHLPLRVSETWLGDFEDCRDLAQVASAVGRLLEPLQAGDRPLRDWAARIRQVLSNVYGRRDWSTSSPGSRFDAGAATIIQNELVQQSSVPANIAEPMDASESLEILLDHVREKSIADPADPDAIELLGWLELPLDDAPCLIALGLNEGTIPKSDRAEMFLPDSLRRHLGIDDQVQRLARDAYALRILVECRQTLRVVVGRRDAAGDPLKPSRLLFADQPDVVSRRWLRFLESESPAIPIPTAFATSTQHAFHFHCPRPVKQPQPLEKMRTTDFRLYLSCPYRFYLRRVLGLERVDDTQIEMDGALFGTVVHDVLARFGRGDKRDSLDPREIQQELERLLEQQIHVRFGQDISPALRVQGMQMKLRLDRFATVQAAWRRCGWRIEHVEEPEESIAEIESPSGSMRLTGRIDRIDIHEPDGRRVILDYKTSDTSKSPEQTHRAERGTTWVDLQLPLYRVIARSMGFTNIDTVGYILLPKKLDEVKFCLAEWTASDYSKAERTAAQVVDRVLNQVFEPPGKPIHALGDDFAPLLLAGVQERPAWPTDARDAS